MVILQSNQLGLVVGEATHALTVVESVWVLATVRVRLLSREELRVGFNALAKGPIEVLLVALVLNIRHEEFVSVDVLTDAEELVPMEMHVADIFIVVGQVAPIGEDKLEAVVQEPVLVEGQDEPRQRLVMRLHILQLTIDVGDTAPVGEIFRDEVPVVRHWLRFPITRKAVKCIRGNGTSGWTYKPILEEMV